MEGPWLSMGPEGGVINGTLVCWLIRGTWGRNCDDTPPMAVCVIGIVCWVPHWGSVASPVGDGPSEEDPVYSRFPLESGISGWIPMGPYNSRITSSTVSSDSLWAESRSKVRLSHTLLLQLHVRVFMFYKQLTSWNNFLLFLQCQVSKIIGRLVIFEFDFQNLHIFIQLLDQFKFFMTKYGVW